MKKSTQWIVLGCLVFGITLACNVAVGIVRGGLDRPMESDAFYYLRIAESMARGDGYALKEGFWPESPTMSRTPGWPFVVAVVLKAGGSCRPDAAMRLTGFILNAIAALGVFVLTARLTRRPVVGGIAGMLYAIHPTALFLADGGGCEALFQALIVWGMVGVAHGAERRAQSAESGDTGCGIRDAGGARDEGGDLKTEEQRDVSQSTQSTQRGVSGRELRSDKTTLFSAVSARNISGDENDRFSQSTQSTQRGDTVRELRSDKTTLFSAVSANSARHLSGGTNQESGTGEVLVRGLWSVVSSLSGLAASLLFGLAVLVRANFVLLPFFVFGLLFMSAVWRLMRRMPVQWMAFARLAVFTVVFLVPVGSWMARNRVVSGEFPVVSTLRGQTFYGGNNAVVADTLDMWGYWVFPDEIPGERKMFELSGEMSEVEVDRYYFSRGLEYVKNNARAMPRLLLGKLTRAYVPVPWKPLTVSYAVGAFRFLLFALAMIGLIRCWRGLPPAFLLLACAMVLVNIATVLLFWGCARFAFEIESLLMPLAAMAVVRGERGEGKTLDHRP